MAVCGGGNAIDINIFDDALEDLQTIEDAANSKLPTAPARITGTVRTLQGRLIEIGGYQELNGGVWADAIEFNEYDEYMIYNGTAYKVKPSVVLPVTSTVAPDLNDFEPFTLTLTQDDVSNAIDEYNKVSLGKYTDYVFATVADMTNALTIGGETITFSLGQSLKVNGEDNEVSCFVVVDSAPGVALTGGLYAREVFAKVSDTSGSVNNPLASLNPSQDARNFPVPQITTLTATPANVSLEYAGGVLSPSNKIYFMPNAGDTILKVDISAGNAVSVLAGTVGAANQGYRSAGLGIDGNIYSASNGGNLILKIDTSDDSFTELAGLNPANIGFEGTVPADNGKIYFIPSLATQVVEFDPLGPSVSYIGSTYSTDPMKWAGGCLGGNGKIYCAPFDDANILEIDPVLHQTRLIPTVTSATFGRWRGCCIAPGGLIYFMPHNADRVMTYNPDTDAVAYLADDLGLAVNKWAGAVLGKNGRIYGMPYASTTVLEIDPSDDTITTYSFESVGSSNKFIGGVMSVDGIIYGGPSNGAQKILVIDGIEGNVDWQLSAYSNKY